MSDGKSSNLFLKQVLCGAGAGAFTKTVTAPLERVKILYQLQGMKAGGIGKNRKYRNFYQTGKIIWVGGCQGVLERQLCQRFEGVAGLCL